MSSRSIEEILEQPPSGCYVNSDGNGAIATVSLRSFVGFLFPAGFALFWNSIISVFVLIAIAGLYSNFIGPVPAWFPAPGVKEGKPEMNGGPMDLGMTLFLCVFLIPFVTVGIVMISIALMNLFGKVEVVIDEFDSYVSTGIGFIRWKKRFEPSEVRAIELVSSTWQSEGRNSQLIELVANRTVKFGTLLKSDQIEWLREVLRRILLPQDYHRKTPTLPQLTWLSRRPK